MMKVEGEEQSRQRKQEKAAASKKKRRPASGAPTRQQFQVLTHPPTAFL